MHNSPVDLTALAGKRYQLSYDESHKGKTPDPWLAIVPCRAGHIYAHSATQIGIATNTRAMGHKLVKLPGVEVLQEADDGFNLAAPAKLFGQIAKAMGARRKRQLSDSERKRIAEQGRASLAKRRLANAGSDLQSAQGTKTAPVDTLAA